MLLIGEPLGMLGTLVLVWGRALADDVGWLARHTSGRVAMVAVVLGATAGLALAVQRVAAGTMAEATARFDVTAAYAPVVRLDAPAPTLMLVDQRGESFDLTAWRGAPAMVTFAFAHCADVCPTLVHQLRDARRAARREQVPIAVVTLDPWRDVPSRLPHIARQWALDAGDRVLSGSIVAVGEVLDAWGVGRARDEKTGDISHAAVAFLLNADGRVVARLDGGVDRMRDLLREP